MEYYLAVQKDKVAQYCSGMDVLWSQTHKKTWKTGSELLISIISEQLDWAAFNSHFNMLLHYMMILHYLYGKQ